MKSFVFYISAIFMLMATSKLIAQPTKKQWKGEKKNIILKDVKSKEITTEFPCNANATIFLENMFRRVNVRISNENKVRLVTSVYYQGDPGFTDEEWLQKLGLRISGNANNVVVKSGNLNQPGAKQEPIAPKPAAPDQPVKVKVDSITNGVAIFDSMGNWTNRKSDIRRNLILYIPANAKLDIESKYSDIFLEENIKDLKVRLNGGGLTMKDAEKLVLNSVYGNIYAGKISDAELEITNGRLIAANITKAYITSQSSGIELGIAGDLTLSSTNDQIEIEELGSIKGNKNYGDLRITSLKKTIDLTGINANVRIRSIDPEVTLVKIDDQYADIRLSLTGIKNYSVEFEGTGGNVYASFEKTAVTESSFKARVGDANAKPLLFQLKCNNCSVDFR